MNYFVLSLPTAQGEREFIFNRMVTPTAVKNLVPTHDEGKSCAFTMEAKKESWRVVNASKVPDWILETESCLSEAINCHQV